ncbi:MAG: hypothetical protein KME26_00725 [Oscillatoria princeps RMCB-10]|nr:hypothetical protein [Oscillatoria princeps RMCB-10]
MTDESTVFPCLASGAPHWRSASSLTFFEGAINARTLPAPLPALLSSRSQAAVAAREAGFWEKQIIACDALNVK